MRTCLLVEVAELAVAVLVLGALQRLAGALQRVALLLEQPAHGVVADRVVLRGQRLGELAGRPGRPAQRATGIAAGLGAGNPKRPSGSRRSRRSVLDQVLGLTMRSAARRVPTGPVLSTRRAARHTPGA
jgi:hypothetical protein